MKKKIEYILFIILLLLLFLLLTACTNKEEVSNNIVEENIIEQTENEENKLYKWVIEPKIEADDIIDIDTRKEVSLIKVGKKYNFINNDQGKKLLREDFFGYAILDDGEIYVWQEGEKPYKVNDDYSLEQSDYAGDFSHNTVYFNKDRKELFTQNYVYLTMQKDEELLEKHIKKHGIALETFVEVTPSSFTEDEFDTYAEFSEEDLGKYGYYNKETLEIEILPIYDKAYNFYENYAAVKKGLKAGFIDIYGEEVFSFEFEETRSLDEGKAWVKINGKWGVIEFIN